MYIKILLRAILQKGVALKEPMHMLPPLKIPYHEGGKNWLSKPGPKRMQELLRFGIVEGEETYKKVER